MTTLDDLFALLPDNTTGDISAADLRAVVEAVWTAGAGVEARVGALEVGGGGTAPTVVGKWKINPTAGAVPGKGQVTCDTGVLATASWVRFDDADADGIDWTAALVAATRLYGQETDDGANFADYAVDSATDQGDYVELGVTLNASGGATPSAGWRDAVVAITFGGP